MSFSRFFVRCQWTRLIRASAERHKSFFPRRCSLLRKPLKRIDIEINTTDTLQAAFSHSALKTPLITFSCGECGIIARRWIGTKKCTRSPIPELSRSHPMALIKSIYNSRNSLLTSRSTAKRRTHGDDTKAFAKKSPAQDFCLFCAIKNESLEHEWTKCDLNCLWGNIQSGLPGTLGSFLTQAKNSPLLACFLLLFGARFAL